MRKSSDVLETYQNGVITRFELIPLLLQTLGQASSEQDILADFSETIKDPLLSEIREYIIHSPETEEEWQRAPIIGSNLLPTQASIIKAEIKRGTEILKRYFNV